MVGKSINFFTPDLETDRGFSSKRGSIINLKLTNMIKFNISSAIKVQTRQLNHWKMVLRPDVFEDLKNYAIELNESAQTPSDIKRGRDLDDFIANYKINL